MAHSKEELLSEIKEEEEYLNRLLKIKITPHNDYTDDIEYVKEHLEYLKERLKQLED
jgi:ubiquinone biosynthesis protein UbiJ